MRVVVDSQIPFIKGVFDPYVDVVYRDEISHSDLTDADAIVIRNVTRCGSDLLDGTPVRMIATATVGMDHIDQQYCKDRGIFVQNSCGSNAGGVSNYVLSAMFGIAARKSIPLVGGRAGIIGVGNVGRRLVKMFSYLGIRPLMYDPVRAEAEGKGMFMDLEDLLSQADVVVMCVPLNSATRGMADARFFASMKPGAIFINVSRGEVMVDEDLKRARGKLGAIVIDTWNNEPDIDHELVEMVDIATPHIAGYSYQSMQNSTMMAVRAIARFFGIKDLYDFFPPVENADLESIKIDLKGKSQGEIAATLQYNYPIFTDDFMLRIDPDSFSALRAGYSYRREFYMDY